MERTPAGRYALGVKLLQFGSHVHGKVDLLREAKPIMEWLCSQVGETVNLTVREGDEVVYVERVISNRMMRVEQVIGSRAPLHVTAVGKLFLAEEGEKGLPRIRASHRAAALHAQHPDAGHKALGPDYKSAQAGLRARQRGGGTGSRLHRRTDP